MDTHLINEFLAKDLQGSDLVIKNNLIKLDGLMRVITQEKEELLTNLQQKEQEFLRLNGAWANQLGIVEELAKQRKLQEQMIPEEEKTNM